MVDHSRGCRGPRAGCLSGLPALLVGGGDALAGGALRGLADRAGDRHAVGDLLLGADFAGPFIVGGGDRLAGAEAGSGLGDVDLGGLVGLVVPRRVGGDAGNRHHALLGHVVAVRERERGVAADRHLLADGGAELALLRIRIDPGFDRGLVPDRARAGRVDGGPGAAAGLRQATAVRAFLRQQFRHGGGLVGYRHVGPDLGVPDRRDRLFHRHRRGAVGLVLVRPVHAAVGGGGGDRL